MSAVVLYNSDNQVLEVLRDGISSGEAHEYADTLRMCDGNFTKVEPSNTPIVNNFYREEDWYLPTEDFEAEEIPLFKRKPEGIFWFGVVVLIVIFVGIVFFILNPA